MCRALIARVSVFPLLSANFRLNFVSKTIAIMKDNRLVEIPIQDLNKLRDLYKDRKTEACAYNMIQNYIEWFQKDPHLDTAKFYSLDGDWSDGTFVLKDSYLILFDTLDRTGETSRLIDILCLFDYSSLRVFNGYDSRLQSVVDEVIKKLNLNDSHRLNGSYDLYVLPQGAAANLVARIIPNGLSLAPLNEDHADIIDNIWDFRHEGSRSATRALIKYGKSLGAFTNDGCLVGWIIVQQTGALGLLKVHENYRSLGIASMLIVTIAKAIAATEQDVMTLISPDNVVSKTLFEGIGFKRERNNSLMFNTLNESEDRLLDVLNCLDSAAEYFFHGFPNRIRPIVEKYLKQFGISPSIANTTIWYHISREEALEFDTNPPDGIVLSPVRQEHVHTINSIWPHRSPGSEVFVSRLISMNLNMGAYDRDGVLLAWIFKLPIGSLGILHVKDEYKRNGYGSLLVRALSKKLAETGLNVTAPVVESNVASREMFKKLNFKEIDKVYWWQKPAIEKD